MSLINEALKKAERMRAKGQLAVGGAPAAAQPSPAEAPAPDPRASVAVELGRVPKRRKPVRFKTVFLTAGIFGALTVGLLFLTLVGVSGLFESEESGAEPMPAAAEPAASLPIPPAVAELPSVPPRVGTAPANPPEPEPPPPPLPPAPPPEPDPRIIAFVEGLRVAGIRAAGADSKVLMNDRVFRIDSLVDSDLQLTLIAVTPTGLVFRDAHGLEYQKNF